MTKVCVVTIYKHNYGAFLQAYGLQRFLINLGYDAELLDYDYFRDHAILGISIKRIRNPISFIKSVLYRLSRISVSRERDKVLEICAQETLKQSRYYKTYKDVKKFTPDADIFITGSDQVWNPTISEQGFLSRLLEFAPSDKNVLCSYAASVGVTSFSDKTMSLMQTNLKRFDMISVREPASEDMIKALTDKEIFMHKDPALLLSREDWDVFAKEIKTTKPYIFIYLAQKDMDLVRYAIDLANKLDYDIVDCHASINYTIPNCVNGKRILSPMEFVGGIKNASYVVTNSFHCLVFSIHYAKRAYIKMPPKGSGRLSELIKNMSLQRLLQPELIQEGEEEIIYKNVDFYLDNERIKAKEYLLHLNQLLAGKR